MSRLPSQRHLLFSCAVLMAVAGCSAAPDAPAPTQRDIEKTLRGKTLSNETGARITLRRDGSIEGNGVIGRWWVQKDKVCRTLVAPEALAGTTCQDVSLTDDRVAFQSPGGRTLSFQIED